MQSRRLGSITAWSIPIGGAAAVTLLERALKLNASTVGFALLVVVLAASLRGSLLVGTAAAILAAACFNFFFLPPLHTFAIHDPANWVALAAFLITSVTVSRLVSRARQEAERAVALAVENAHLQAVRESDALKTSLLRAISHDLTTPLTAIAIHTESPKRLAAGDDDLQEAARGIDGETGRLRRRIENLLSMARLEAGNARPRREPTPPADLFHAVRENLPLVFQSRPVRIHVDDDCPDADVDPSLALEILVNLIENAHRVSPPAAPLELLAKRHPTDPHRVRLEVLDRGPGVPPEVASDTSDIAQRGLGLEIARSFATANGGTIGLAPRDGGGTVAHVDFVAAALPAAGEMS